MSTITTNYSTSVQTDYKVENTKPLTDAEIKAKIIEVQTENLQAIEQGLEQKSTGWGDKVKIKVPADANGKAITNPTAKDWENAVKNNRFAEVEDFPIKLAANYFSLHFVNFGSQEDNLILNKALLKEFSDALKSGISFPTTTPIPRSETGDMVRALQAWMRALENLKIGTVSVNIRVPSDPKGNPIKNPTVKDWINAEKNNSWATASGMSADLASDYFGIKIDTTNWRDTWPKVFETLDQAGKEGTKKFTDKIRSANGEFVIDEILDIPDAGKIIAEVLAALGPAYGTELEKADDLRKQMDNLRKKNDAIKKFENSLEKNSAGNDQISVEVPTSRFVYDKDGNKVKNEDGSFKTEPVGKPPSNEDWARAATFIEVGGKADSLAQEYFGINYQKKDGNNKDDHYANLTANTGKWNNERTSVSSEMSKLSGQFDFRMGNAQTNLQNANKIIASINDMVMGIIKSI
jgi:hypothetical protein